MMKNLDVATVLTLRDQVAYQPGQVVSKTLAQNDAVSVTLFAFDKDEEISTHESGGDALVTCLDGVGRVTVDGVPHVLHTGESILMPARHPHVCMDRSNSKCCWWSYSENVKRAWICFGWRWKLSVAISTALWYHAKKFPSRRDAYVHKP